MMNGVRQQPLGGTVCRGGCHHARRLSSHAHFSMNEEMFVCFLSVVETEACLSLIGRRMSAAPCLCVCVCGRYDRLRRLEINQSQMGDDRPLGAIRINPGGDLAATGG